MPEQPRKIDFAEKANMLRETFSFKIEPGLPCSTLACLNIANVATANYDPRLRCWQMAPICADCAKKQADKYGIS